jgi:hypothetical protein
MNCDSARCLARSKFQTDAIKLLSPVHIVLPFQQAIRRVENITFLFPLQLFYTTALCSSERLAVVKGSVKNK